MDDFMNNPDKFKLPIPPTVYYVPDFITAAEEEVIIAKFYGAPKPKWTQLLNRRLQNWGGIPHPKGMLTEPIPSWLQIYIDRINNLNLMNGNTPNHILANEYTPGQGIMMHKDGPLFYPTVTTISCGSHTVINFQKKDAMENSINQDPIHSILLERRSLFIVQDEMYHDHMHGIDEINSDVVTDNIVNVDRLSDLFTIGNTYKRQTRISLTIRNVPKISKIKFRI